ncbi:hypothetical protein CAL26_09145 [Bordetella genomosp. 9]|uniref:Deoxynucleotide monophosphate kinase n=1 Tax=Bordetella genomosp. 9 TaxID=1416803 RepID=A0A261REX9_9BORD|nr:hypothetical protein [Bordetella genomosp. 9]OZI23596.1 hypothetical protein CAL26_09145 [Bordetella genomosp. 9]
MTSTRNGFRLIGLCGRAGAGKDTCADLMAAAYGFSKIAFADALRAEISRSFGVDPRDLSNRITKEQLTHALAIGRSDDARFIHLMASAGVCISAPRSPRQIMRWWATEYRRALDGEEYWTLLAHDAIDSLMRRGVRRIVVTDVRFSNEASFIKHMRGEVWRVRRAVADQIPGNHRSEIELEAISPAHVVHNDGDIAALMREVHDLCTRGRPTAEIPQAQL